MTCFIQTERQVWVVTKSSQTGAIHSAEAQLTPGTCSLSLRRARTHPTYTVYSWVHAVYPHKDVRAQQMYTKINDLSHTHTDTPRKTQIVFLSVWGDQSWQC